MVADRDRLVAFVGAVLIHVVVIGLLAFSFTQRPEAPTTPQSRPIVQARAVSEEEVMAPVRRREAEEAARQQRIEEQKRQEAETKRRAKEEKQKAVAEKKRQAAEEAKRRAAEQKRQQELKKQKAADQARQAAERKKAEAERQAALKRKQEAERKAAEVKRKAEEARKQREAEEQRRHEAELKAKMAAEAERLAQEQQRQRQQQLLSVRMQYMADIKNKVERSWLRPTGSQGTHCRVLIHQIPGGEVVDVRLTECDGDVAFQRSVEAAVRKASPLPPPPDPEVFDREIEFVFEP